MFARCFRFAGLTEEDRVQLAVGYGQWTAGAGFQAGVERPGAMAVPAGPGNTELQLELMRELWAPRWSVPPPPSRCCSPSWWTAAGCARSWRCGW